MAYLGYEAMKLEKFGGLNTLIDPTNLPVYASPDTQDTEFLPGLVRTRPGLTSIFPALNSNPTVNYLKTYITPTVSDALRTLVLDSLGVFRKEDATLTPGTLSTVFSNIVPASYANSVSLFNREYIAIGDGKYGIDIPRQFDDVNFDRVSQVGPGAPPGVTDENITLNTQISPTGLTMFPSNTIVASPNGLSESGNIVTVTITVAAIPSSLAVGDSINISGAGVAGYNGTFPVLSISADRTSITCFNSTSGLAASGGGSLNYPLASAQLTSNHGFGTVGQTVNGLTVTVAGAGVAGYNGTWPVRGILSTSAFSMVIASYSLAASGGATVVVVGHIVAGVHEISVVFVTRQGYVTAPAPFGKWTAAGSKRAVVSNIPIGPSNIVSRILIFTAAGGQSFFYSIGDPSIFSSNMIITDNTTTSVTIDFSDTILLSGVSADALFNLLELGECSGVSQYSSRLFWLGERNKIQNFVNLSFDGGGGVGNYPLGWSRDTANGGGGSLIGSNVSGLAYAIIGDGVTATLGLITQGAYQDAFGNPILSPLTSYSVRVRVQSLNGLTQGVLHINLKSVSAGLTTTGLSVSFSQVNAVSVKEFIAEIVTNLQIPNAVPADLVLQVYADGTMNAPGKFLVDCIEVFPTAKPYNMTVVRASKVEDPESYDGVTGFLQVAENNGQAVRCSYTRRDNLYFVKERSLYVTRDDGVNEPNQWTVEEVSQKVGTLSVRGVGFGDEWEIIAGLDGVYYFDGGEPQKISQEIQPTWDSINWSLGHLIDVKIDTKRKRVYIAVPLGAGATANNRVLTLDYTDGFGDPNPTNTMNIAGVGRKWSPWLITCNSMNLILRNDGTQQLWFGNGTSTGKIYQLDTTGTIFTDDGAKINDYWQTGYFQDTSRLTFGPLVANVVGAGTLNLILRKGDQAWLTNLRGWLMSANGFRNMERMLNIETERLALRFASAGTGDHFSLQGLSLYAREAVWAPLRGING